MTGEFSYKEFYLARHNENIGNSLADRLRIVGKTVFGKPISQNDLQTIYENIDTYIDLIAEDFSTLIDLGCGTGLITEHLNYKYNSKHVIGIDPLEENISLCKQHCKCISGDFYLGSSENFPFETYPNSIIVMYEVAQHMSVTSIRKFLTSAFRAGCKGVILGGVPNILYRDEFYRGRISIPVLNDNCDDIIGTWYNTSDFDNPNEYLCSIKNQRNLYTSFYRFDAIFTASSNQIR